MLRELEALVPATELLTARWALEQFVRAAADLHDRHIAHVDAGCQTRLINGGFVNFGAALRHFETATCLETCSDFPSQRISPQGFGHLRALYTHMSHLVHQQHFRHLDEGSSAPTLFPSVLPIAVVKYIRSSSYGEAMAIAAQGVYVQATAGIRRLQSILERATCTSASDHPRATVSSSVQRATPSGD